MQGNNKDYPVIAIVGRPNVGKSSIFNKLVGKRIAIVDHHPGITRDRVASFIEIKQQSYMIYDTSGFFENPESEIEENMLKQLEEAMLEAHVILFVVDSQMGIHPMDRVLLKKLRPLEKPLFLIANKADDEKIRQNASEFLKLGIKECFYTSATHNRGFKEVLHAVNEVYPGAVINQDALKICIVGKPNVGKSSLFNQLLKEDRAIVSKIAGTTRDAISSMVTWEDQSYLFIDTAGLTRKKNFKEAVGHFSEMRTQDSIKSADLCILVLDATNPMEGQDKRIARLVADEKKPILVLINKWDLINEVRQEHFRRDLLALIPWFEGPSFLFVSSVSGLNITKIFPALRELKNRAFAKISTSVLNQALTRLTEKKSPPLHRGKRLRIYYGLQKEINPPLFLLFVNHPRHASPNYLKYLKNQFEEVFDMKGIPLQFELKGKKKQDNPFYTPGEKESRKK